MADTLILGDPHVGHDPDADEALADVLRRLAVPSTDLLIMGDLFVGWIARERFWTEEQRRFIDLLRNVRRAGGHTRFVVGNRDYLAKGLEGDTFDVVYDGEVVVDVGGARTLLLHGDGLNPADRPYRAWRALSRNPIADALLEHLPGAIGRRLAASTERSLRDVNRQYKSGPLPQAALDAVGRRAAIAGAIRAVVGHFHADETIETSGVPVRVAPGWFEHRKLLLATDAGFESVTSDDPRTSPAR